VSIEQIHAEGYNCNIRRYVDTAPPEPHDVQAHLHGGVPTAEVDALEWTSERQTRHIAQRSDKASPGPSRSL